MEFLCQSFKLIKTHNYVLSIMKHKYLRILNWFEYKDKHTWEYIC